MTRVPIAIIVGLLGFFAYIGLAMIIADHILRLHWIVQGLYFVVAGTLWVMPMRWLMFWSVHLRG